MTGELKDVNEFRNLGEMIIKDCGGKAKPKSTVMQRTIVGVLKALLNGKELSVECTGNLHNGILVLTLMYRYA